MNLRAALAGLIALGWAGAAMGQEPEDGLGPYEFGMSTAAAQAVSPNAAWRVAPGPDGTQTLSGGPRLQVAGAPFSAILLFRDDQLKQIALLARAGATCADTVPALVAELEFSFGAFDGAPGPGEPSLPTEVVRTEGGSELRTHESGEPAVREIYASRRGGMFMQVFGRPDDADPAACSLTLLFDSTPAYVGPGSELTPAELAAAQTIVGPVWDTRPNAEDFARFYPPNALSRGVGGAAVLDCVISVQGSLRCLVSDETPRNEGFADAAMRLSRQFTVRQDQSGAAAAGKRVRVVIRFNATP